MSISIVIRDLGLGRVLKNGSTKWEKKGEKKVLVFETVRRVPLRYPSHVIYQGFFFDILILRYLLMKSSRTTNSPNRFLGERHSTYLVTTRKKMS